MTRPPWEVADVIQRGGSRFLDRYRKSLTWQQVKVLNAIMRCRTAALGGHLDQCDRCQHRTVSYNSCRNRHCPKCQTSARDKWLRSRQQELLPVTYYHVVFSVPHRLVPLVWQNKRVLFALLFEATAATLLEVAANPKRLGALIGFLSVLHTWGQTLQPHPHIHCVVPDGGLSPRPPKLEAFAAKLLLASARSQPRVSRQVRCWPEATLSQEPVAVLRSLPAVIGRKGIQRLPSHTLSRRVGHLRQAAV